MVNFLGIVQTSDELITIIYEYLNNLKIMNKDNIMFILRLLGGEVNIARERLSGLPVEVIENLEDAVTKAVSLAK
ncbi:MAG: hypothetical protein F6K17_11825 [Okeania sp. SIO3C4]|nr:hypothetical protein [Okeania sp. SIO3C4]